MKKIPTLFRREFENHQIVNIFPDVTPGMEWVLKGEGIATEKYDGSCCAIIDGKFYRRYDAKKGKKIPQGAIPCQKEPDPVTGHFPCWIACKRENASDKWYWAAYDAYMSKNGFASNDWTYEAIGPHFQANPYHLENDILVPHGKKEIKLANRSFDGIRKYLLYHEIEGIVFWKDGMPQCKIKRSDFGFAWNQKK